MSLELIGIALLTFFFAGTIKGVIGIGLPTASMSVLVQFVDPRAAIVMLLSPMVVSNIWQVYRSGNIARSIKVLWPFATTMLLSTWLVSLQAARFDTDVLVLVLGCTIILLTLISLWKTLPSIPSGFDHPIQLIGGFLAGVFGGLTAIWGPPMIAYLLARQFDKEDFVRFTGFLFVIGSIPLSFGYWQSGLLTGDGVVLSLSMVAPTLLGFSVGERIRPKLTNHQFRTVVLLVFAVLGLNLIRRGLFAA